jgi:hypothetical protein
VHERRRELLILHRQVDGGTDRREEPRDTGSWGKPFGGSGIVVR